jgi:hypothetical protein
MRRRRPGTTRPSEDSRRAAGPDDPTRYWHRARRWPVPVPRGSIRPILITVLHILAFVAAGMPVVAPPGGGVAGCDSESGLFRTACALWYSSRAVNGRA